MVPTQARVARPETPRETVCTRAWGGRAPVARDYQRDAELGIWKRDMASFIEIKEPRFRADLIQGRAEVEARALTDFVGTRGATRRG